MEMNLMKMDLMKKKKKKGFTLIELIVVIAIIGILAAVAVPRFSGFTNQAKLASDKAMAANIAKAVELYNIANNQAVTYEPTPATLITAKLLTAGDFKPKSTGGLGYLIKVADGKCTVNFATVVSATPDATWGTTSGDQLFPVTP